MVLNLFYLEITRVQVGNLISSDFKSIAVNFDLKLGNEHSAVESVRLKDEIRESIFSQFQKLETEQKQLTKLETENIEFQTTVTRDRIDRKRPFFLKSK